PTRGARTARPGTAMAPPRGRSPAGGSGFGGRLELAELVVGLDATILPELEHVHAGTGQRQSGSRQLPPEEDAAVVSGPGGAAKPVVARAGALGEDLTDGREGRLSGHLRVRCDDSPPTVVMAATSPAERRGVGLVQGPDVIVQEHCRPHRDVFHAQSLDGPVQPSNSPEGMVGGEGEMHHKAVSAEAVHPFGEALRRWRGLRRVSQLELALRAGTTQRHLSFVERGRSVPGRRMVVRLAESLHLPLRERNALLLAAGYAPAYDETPLDADALRAVREALDVVLKGHEPYPAMIVNRAGELLASNAAC